jgi:hypothetical protein
MLITRQGITRQLEYYTGSTGYHLQSFLISNWLFLALCRYTYALSHLHPNWALISVLVKPGFSPTKVASCRCAGLVKLICLYFSRCCFLRMIDWRSPLFPRLQAQQDVTKLSRLSVPPSAKETLWSTSSCASGAPCPQYWQVKESLAKICQRNLYHPFRSILFVIGKLYSTRGIESNVVAVSLFCNERRI